MDTGAQFVDAVRGQEERRTDEAPMVRTVPPAGLAIEPPSVPDGTFVKVAPEDHPLPRA